MARPLHRKPVPKICSLAEDAAPRPRPRPRPLPIPPIQAQTRNDVWIPYAIDTDPCSPAQVAASPMSVDCDAFANTRDSHFPKAFPSPTSPSLLSQRILPNSPCSFSFLDAELPLYQRDWVEPPSAGYTESFFGNDHVSSPISCEESLATCSSGSATHHRNSFFEKNSFDDEDASWEVMSVAESTVASSSNSLQVEILIIDSCKTLT